LCFGAEQPGHVLYPTSDEVAWLVAAHSEELSPYFSLYTPPIESLIRLLDKARLAEEARAAGLDAPETIVVRNEDEVERCSREMEFPLYVKPRAQVFGRSIGKGARIDAPSRLRSAWRAQREAAIFDPEVQRQMSDICLPLLQRCVSGSERIYTVDGFIDETGEVCAMLACVKVLQRPRGSGPGIIFEHAKMDPQVEEGLRRLFRNTGFFGVFDVEFLEICGRKLLIDINPRYYNHMAFESERGLNLPWLAYLAAAGNRSALKAEVATFKSASISRQAYVHRLPTELLLSVQRLAGRMSAEDQLYWNRRISGYRDSITDPVRTADDPNPALAEVAAEAINAIRHPRSYLRGLLQLPV
jgi:D-aspartate ligase